MKQIAERATLYLLHAQAGFFLPLLFDFEKRRYLSSKRPLIYKGLHEVISQKIEHFISIFVITELHQH